jgi:HEAT repeat protein
MVSLSQATAVVSVLTICIAGCMGTSEPAPLTVNEIEQRLSDYDERIGPPPAEAADGLLHALGSSDPEMRAQAAISLGKSGGLSSVARERLETMASNDKSRLAQLAALQALERLDLLTPELEEALRQ